MRALLATFSIAAGIGWAQTVLTAPQAGFMQDASHSLRPVYGIAGNFLLGDPVAVEVISAAYSGSYGLIKTDSAVAVIDKTGSIAACVAMSDGPVLYAFATTGEPALVYLMAANTLLAWNSRAFDVIPFDPAILGAGAIVSLAAPDSGHAALIVHRDDGLWDVRVQLATGEIDSQT